jgi:TfoX/Sxy family transcriptional regulator of competence genes
MAYDEDLAGRIRKAVARKKGITEKKMFGGLGFLLNGNMLVGVWKNSMIVRMNADDSEAALREPHVGVFDITGKPMKGWLMVAAEGVGDEDAVKRWVKDALKYVSKLPAK